MKRTKLLILMIILVSGIGLAQTSTTETEGMSQITSFTYQGKLTDGGTPANGQYDLKFRLFDSPAGGSQVGGDVFGDDVQATAGVFTVNLDFGSFPFTTDTGRYLEISIRPGASTGAYTTLAPLQQLTGSPYSVRSVNAAAADNLSSRCDPCVTDSKIVSIDGAKVTGTVANATNAFIAGNVSGVVQIANGGTGRSTKDFVDLTTNQTINGRKIFNDRIVGDGSQLTNLNGANIAPGSVAEDRLPAGFRNGYDPQQVATLRWDLVFEPRRTDFAVGSLPYAIAFDGEYMWVANFGDDSVTKLRASDGADMGTFPARENPIAIAYDGTSIWVVNNSTDRVTKLSTSGTPIQSVPVGSNPVAIAFDGTNIWVVNEGSDNVSRIRASDGTSLDPIPAVNSPRAIAFDGKFMWVGGLADPLGSTNNLILLRASDGASLRQFLSCTPGAMASDGGARVFITCNDPPPSNRSVDIAWASYSVSPFPPYGSRRTIDFLPYTPQGIAFDGLNMWATSTTSDDCRDPADPNPIPCGPPKVVRFDAESVSPLNTFTVKPLVRGSSLVGNSPKGVAFDGTSIWVANSGSNTVSKITFRRPAPETGVKQ